MRNKGIILSILLLILVLSCRIQHTQIPQILINTEIIGDTINISSIVQDWPGLWLYRNISIKNIATNKVWYIDSERQWHPIKQEGTDYYFVKQIPLEGNGYSIKKDVKYEFEISIESPVDAMAVVPFNGRIIFNLMLNSDNRLKITDREDEKIRVLIENIKIVKEK